MEMQEAIRGYLMCIEAREDTFSRCTIIVIMVILLHPVNLFFLHANLCYQLWMCIGPLIGWNSFCLCFCILYSYSAIFSSLNLNECKMQFTQQCEEL